MFIDKVFAVEFYNIRNMYKDISKHLYDITILAQTKEIKELLQDKQELEKLISYKRQEESIRKGEIDANIKIKDFTYLKQDFNEDLLTEFENMQNKYKKENCTGEHIDNIGIDEDNIECEVALNKPFKRNLCFGK